MHEPDLKAVSQQHSKTEDEKLMVFQEYFRFTSVNKSVINNF